jgi:hypothetical protein
MVVVWFYYNTCCCPYETSLKNKFVGCNVKNPNNTFLGLQKICKKEYPYIYAFVRHVMNFRGKYIVLRPHPKDNF